MTVRRLPIRRYTLPRLRKAAVSLRRLPVSRRMATACSNSRAVSSLRFDIHLARLLSGTTSPSRSFTALRIKRFVLMSNGLLVVACAPACPPGCSSYSRLPCRRLRRIRAIPVHLHARRRSPRLKYAGDIMRLMATSHWRLRPRGFSAAKNASSPFGNRPCWVR